MAAGTRRALARLWRRGDDGLTRGERFAAAARFAEGVARPFTKAETDALYAGAVRKRSLRETG